MINNKLEDSIKSSLENYEIPYDESAWTAMSAKLDKVKPVKEPFLAKPKNWFIISASLVTITSITLFFVLDSNQPTKKSEKKSNTSITPNLSEEKNEQIKITESGPSTKRKIKNKSIKKIIESKSASQDEKIIKNEPIVIKNYNDVVKNDAVSIIPVTLNAYCQYEQIEFSNKNNFIIVLKTPSRSIQVFPSKKETIELREVGNYYWISEEDKNNSQVLKLAFRVKENPYPTANLGNDIQIVNGIPCLKATTSSNSSITWFLNNEKKGNEKEVKFTLFTKGPHYISLSIVNENSCENKINMTYNAEENYNLLSPNGIETTHSDPRRRTFMPEALKERNTPFRMIIINPTDGKTIFETSDADNPWDGTNQHTGELVPTNIDFIWKVYLSHPEKNEKNEYYGKITRI